MIVAGIKLPGLEFRNQRVEAAFRKELVLGEDDEKRAEPETLKELFANVRRNYFRIYIHYTYFNLFRNFYFQLNNLFAYILLIPTIAAGTITLGIMNQIIRAFSEVTSSFQYLVRSWSTIIDLISVFKRLQAFEAAFKGEELSNLDKEYIETKGKVDLMKSMTKFDAERIYKLVQNHYNYTNSDKAKKILDNWDEFLPKFVKVMPVDYRRALVEIEKQKLELVK